MNYLAIDLKIRSKILNQVLTIAEREKEDPVVVLNNQIEEGIKHYKEKNH